MSQDEFTKKESLENNKALGEQFFGAIVEKIQERREAKEAEKNTPPEPKKPAP